MNLLASRWFPFLIISLLTILVYGATLHHSFQFDDFTYIVDNPEVHQIKDLSVFFNSSVHQSRLIPFISLALNYYFGKLDVVGYHIVNILIHWINGLLVYGLVRLLFLTPRLKQGADEALARLAALFTALLFVAHPIQTQAVTYIVQRFASIATMFYLSAMCAYLWGRINNRGLFYFLAVFLSLLGMFSKEIVFTWPIMVLICEALFFKSSIKRWQLALMVIGLLTIIPLMFKFNFNLILQSSKISGSHDGDRIYAYNYFLTQGRVIVEYLRLLVLPIGQNIDHDFPVSNSLWEAGVLPSFLLLFLIFMTALRMLRENVLFSFGVFWFFITLSVESSIIPIPHVIFEHRVYLPSVGFFLALVMCALKSLKFRKSFGLILAIGVLIFSVLSIERNKVWKDEITLWTDAALKSPQKARPLLNLGSAYLRANDLDRAEHYLKRAMALDLNLIDVHNNLGVIYFRRGEKENALKHFNFVIKDLHPAYYPAYFNRGTLYVAMGQEYYDAALKDFEKTVQLNPEHKRAFNNRGLVYMRQADYQKAQEDFNQALAIDSGYLEARQNRATLFALEKKFDLAVADHKIVLATDPYNYLSLVNWGKIKFIQKDWEGALVLINQAISFDPQNGLGYYYRGLVYRAQGQADIATNDFEKAKVLGVINKPELGQ